MIKIIVSVLTINVVLAIGVDGLKIPLNPVSMKNGKTSQVGINYVGKLFEGNSFIQYNSLSWIPGISGQSINWKNGDGFFKYLSVSSISDDEVYLHGEIPNDNSNVKLPATLYSSSILISSKVKTYDLAFELNSFLSRLYYEKKYGILVNLIFSKHFKENNYASITVKNIGILDDKIKFEYPEGMLFKYERSFRNKTYLIGLGLDYISENYTSFTYLGLNKSYISVNIAIDYNSNDDLGYFGDINIHYKNLTVGYGHASPLFESAKSPKIVSLKYNF